MALPVQDKTWEIVPNVRTHLDSSSAENTNKNLALLIKNQLSSFTNNPWVVESSSDSVTASNNDQVDRWATITDIVHSAGNHSWVVHKDPVTGQQFCLDFNDATTAARDATVAWSASGSFGTSGGGGDGTIAARPTAPDEVVVRSLSSWGPGETTFAASAIHFWRATDGTCTRIAMMRDRSCRSFWGFDTPKDPIGAWSPAAVCPWVRSTGCLTYAGMNDLSTRINFSQTGVGQGLFYAATIGTLSAGVLENGGGRVAHGVNGDLQTVPVRLLSPTANLRGVWGSMFDWHWASDVLRTGEIIRSATDAWVCIDDMWLPWTLTDDFLVA